MFYTTQCFLYLFKSNQRLIGSTVIFSLHVQSLLFDALCFSWLCAVCDLSIYTNVSPGYQDSGLFKLQSWLPE